jgi:hypothetical protein
MAALCNRRTRFGAIESTNQAIEFASTPDKKRYLTRDWLRTIDMWANFAREHSPLLLQVVTTNANEAYHRSLKALASITKLVIRPKYSLAGIISLIDQCDKGYFARAQKGEYDWRSKKLSAVLQYPWLEYFPYQVQLLLLAEIKAAERLAEDGTEPRLENDTCDCKFSRAYWLPCQHVIYAFCFLGAIEEPDWSEYARLFDESGFEIYSTTALVEVEDPTQAAKSRVNEAKLNTSETLDTVRTRFFEIAEHADSLEAPEQEDLLDRWDKELRQCLSPLIGRPLPEWILADPGRMGYDN